MKEIPKKLNQEKIINTAIRCIYQRHVLGLLYVCQQRPYVSHVSRTRCDTSHRTDIHVGETRLYRIRIINNRITRSSTRLGNPQGKTI